MAGVVYLTRYAGNKMPPLYLGSSTEENILSGYHGTVTSKMFRDIWNLELKQHPELFTTEIISHHSTRLEAMKEELRIQKELDIIRNPEYINRAYAQPRGFFGPSQAGVSKSKDHSQKISDALTGRVFTPKHCQNIASGQRNKKPTTKEALENMSRAQSGSNNARSLTYRLTSPLGDVSVVSDGLKRFCGNYDLSMSKMFRYIDKGIIPKMDNKQSKMAANCTGWKIEKL